MERANDPRNQRPRGARHEAFHALSASCLALVLSLPAPPANATAISPAAPACSDIFAAPEASARRQRLPFFKPRSEFDLARFSSLRERFAQRLKAGAAVPAAELADPVAKLAYLEAVSRIRGLDLYRFGDVMRDLTPAQIKEIRKALRKFGTDGETGWTKAQRALVKLYLATHYDPTAKGLFDTFKTPLAQTEKELILQRVQVSLVKNSLTDALVDLGFVRSPSALEKARARFHGVERAVRLSGSAAMNVLSFYIPFMNSDAPPVILSARDLPRSLEARYLREGWGSVETEVQRVYGRSARAQAVLSRVERVLGTITLPLIAYFLWDEIQEMGNATYQVFFESEEAAEKRRWNEDDIVLSASQREVIVEQLLQRMVNFLLPSLAPLDATPDQLDETRQMLWDSPQIAVARDKFRAFTNRELVTTLENNDF